MNLLLKMQDFREDLEYHISGCHRTTGTGIQISKIMGLKSHLSDFPYGTIVHGVDIWKRLGPTSRDGFNVLRLIIKIDESVLAVLRLS